MISATESLDAFILLALDETEAIKVNAVTTTLSINKLNIFSDINTKIVHVLRCCFVIMVLKNYANFLSLIESKA